MTEEPKWLKGFKIGDTAYMVRHTPWYPSKEEKEKLEAEGEEIIQIAYNKEENELFTSLSKAIQFARKIVKTDFWGCATVYEARLVNPYSEDVPDWQLKRTALRWEQIEGGYECEIER
jgi:hypothetical protein